MKRIKDYDGKSLETFTVSLTYEKDIIGIKIDNITPLADKISKVYKNKPLLGLLKRRFTEITLGHLRFYDEKKINYVEVGKDFLVFAFNNYSKWEKELPKILQVFDALNEYVELPNINKIVLTYIDIFNISLEDFQYNKYFSFPKFVNEFEWDIKFHDIYLGFVPYEEVSHNEKKKIVLRLKSGGIESEKFIFRLETVGSVDDFKMEPQSNLLKQYLDDCHDKIEDYFINFLTKEYREELELVIDDY